MVHVPFKFLAHRTLVVGGDVGRVLVKGGAAHRSVEDSDRNEHHSRSDLH